MKSIREIEPNQQDNKRLRRETPDFDLTKQEFAQLIKQLIDQLPTTISMKNPPKITKYENCKADELKNKLFKAINSNDMEKTINAWIECCKSIKKASDREDLKCEAVLLATSLNLDNIVGFLLNGTPLLILDRRLNKQEEEYVMQGKYIYAIINKKDLPKSIKTTTTKNYNLNQAKIVCKTLAGKYCKVIINPTEDINSLEHHILSSLENNYNIERKLAKKENRKTQPVEAKNRKFFYSSVHKFLMVHNADTRGLLPECFPLTSSKLKEAILYAFMRNNIDILLNLLESFSYTDLIPLIHIIKPKS